jgi:hypothetical protein
MGDRCPVIRNTSPCARNQALIMPYYTNSHSFNHLVLMLQHHARRTRRTPSQLCLLWLPPTMVASLNSSRRPGRSEVPVAQRDLIRVYHLLYKVSSYATLCHSSNVPHQLECSLCLRLLNWYYVDILHALTGWIWRWDGGSLYLDKMTLYYFGLNKFNNTRFSKFWVNLMTGQDE